jgi:hypothetical protein
MKTTKSVLALAAATLITGFSGIHPAQAQPYGYPGTTRPPPYPAPAYPGGYQNPPQQASSTTAEASVEIFAPKDGAIVPPSEPVVLDYDVKPGPNGDHVHVYVDGRQVAIVRQLQGRYEVGRLSPGKHELAIKVVNRAHVPIGVESSVDVTVQ